MLSCPIQVASLGKEPCHCRALLQERPSSFAKETKSFWESTHPLASGTYSTTFSTGSGIAVGVAARVWVGIYIYICVLYIYI